MSRKGPLAYGVRPAPDVEAFVNGDGAVPQGPKRPGGRAPKPPETGRSTFQRQDGREVRRLVVYLPSDLARRLRSRCAEKDVDVSEEVARAVTLLLEG